MSSAKNVHYKIKRILISDSFPMKLKTKTVIILKQKDSQIVFKK